MDACSCLDARQEHELVSDVYDRCVAPDDEGILLSLELRLVAQLVLHCLIHILMLV